MNFQKSQKKSEKLKKTICVTDFTPKIQVFAHRVMVFQKVMLAALYVAEWIESWDLEAMTS